MEPGSFPLPVGQFPDRSHSFAAGHVWGGRGNQVIAANLTHRLHPAPSGALALNLRDMECLAQKGIGTAQHGAARCRTVELMIES